MGHRQKGKHMKRKRSWHHLGNQDRLFRRAIERLDERLREEQKDEEEVTTTGGLPHM